MVFLAIQTPRPSSVRRCSHGNVIHHKEQKEARRTAERLKGKSTRITPHTLKVGSGDGASIRGLFAAAGDSGALFLAAGEQASWTDRPGVEEKLRT